MDATTKSRKQTREDILYIHGCKCNICGYNRYSGALEFHHLDINEKDLGLSARDCGNFEKALEESKKCILLCSNCHKEVHANLISTEIKSSFSLEKEKEIRSLREERQKQNNLNKQKVPHPDRETLKLLVRTKTFSECGKIFGVSATTISKWLIKENLPHTKTEIYSYSKKEWEKL